MSLHLATHLPIASSHMEDGMETSAPVCASRAPVVDTAKYLFFSLPFPFPLCSFLSRDLVPAMLSSGRAIENDRSKVRLVNEYITP